MDIRHDSTFDVLEHLQHRYKAVREAYLSGTDSEPVFRARLFGLGYRGAALTTEVQLANMEKVT